MESGSTTPRLKQIQAIGNPFPRHQENRDERKRRQTINPAITKLVLEDHYHELEKLIYYTIYKFIAKHGGCFADLAEQAGLAFVTAYHRYNPKRGCAFATYVRFVLWNHMLNFQREQAKHSKRISYMDLDPNQHQDKQEFYLFMFLEELSLDAQRVVKLVLRTPPGLRDRMHKKRPQQIRQVLREHLKALGWSAQQIRDSFDEIRRAL